MAELSNTLPTIVDVSRAIGPDGKRMKLIEMSAQTNETSNHFVVQECNKGITHEVWVETGLPEIYVRHFNKGVLPSKSTTANLSFTCSMLEGRSKVDVKVANQFGKANEVRAQFARSFMTSMGRKDAWQLFYGAGPEYYPGLATVYSDRTNSNVKENILSAGGTTTGGTARNASIFLVASSPDTIYKIYPQGSHAGINFRNLGEQTFTDTDGTQMQTYQALIGLDSGLVVADWKFGGRICNIDTNDLAAGTGTQAITATTNIMFLMDDLIAKIPHFNGMRTAFYMNGNMINMLNRMCYRFSNQVLDYIEGTNMFGNSQKWTSYKGIPICKVDQLLSTESAI